MTFNFHLIKFVYFFHYFVLLYFYKTIISKKANAVKH
nr:MAG TPA: hypothetical protein [Caudoviricetes sp.]